jgi:hypothetical protein
MALKQFTEKIVVSDKLTAANFAPAKGAPVSELIITDHLPVDMLLDAVVTSDAVASDLAAVDQPLLMAKADIEPSPVSEYSAAVISDADFAYTDHITSDVATFESDQPELVAMNVAEHIADNAILAAETGGGMPWGWIGAGAVAGGVGGYLLSVGHGDDAPAATVPEDEVRVIVTGEGAFIDVNNDGILDDSDLGSDGYIPADFSAGENAGLADHAVTIHFHEAPITDTSPFKAAFGVAPASGLLDFTGFSVNDMIEIDVNAYYSRWGHRTDISVAEQNAIDTVAKLYTTSKLLNIIVATSHSWETSPDNTKVFPWIVAAGGVKGNNGIGIGLASLTDSLNEYTVLAEPELVALFPNGSYNPVAEGKVEFVFLHPMG